MEGDINEMLEARLGLLKRQIEQSPKGEEFCKFVRGYFHEYLNEMKMLTKEMCLDDKGELIPEYSERLETLLKDFFIKAEFFLTLLGDQLLAKEMRQMFRDFGRCYYQSEIIAHARNKPRGYPGDFEMMNHVYNNVTISRSVVGKYFDRYHLNMGYAQAVRGRKNKMVRLLKSVLDSHNDSSLRILNLPCGPARDVQEFVALNCLREDVAVEVLCVDSDLEALAFAKSAVKNVPENIDVEFKQGNILSYIRKPQLHFSELGKFDLVYSIGLADYLPDRMLQNMIAFSWKLLKDEGFLVYAFKIEERDRFAPVPPSWGCDWAFVSRSMSDALNVIKNSSLGAHVIDEPEWEESGRIVFFKIRKAIG